MLWMLAILFALTIGLDLLKVSGILGLMMKLLSPLFGLPASRARRDISRRSACFSASPMAAAC